MMTIDHHTVAAVSLTGIFLDVLGGLYLAYDLLGGQHGPLRLLTRMVTYSIVFGVGYALGLGLFFGVVSGLATGITIAIELDVNRPPGTIITRCRWSFCLARSGELPSARGCIKFSVCLTRLHFPR